MPKDVENALKRRAGKLGLGGNRRDAFVFGTLNKIKKGQGGGHSNHVTKTAMMMRANGVK